MSEDVTLLLYKFPVVNIGGINKGDYMGPGVVAPACKTEENAKFQTSLSFVHQNCKS